MKKILLYLSLLAFAATALGCSPQAKWNREQKKAMHDALQAYRQMAYLQDLTDPEFVVFSDGVAGTIEEAFPVYATFIEMPAVDDTVDLYVITAIVDELDADAHNMRHLYPYQYLVSQGILPEGLTHEQQVAFYKCFAQKVNAQYSTMDQFFAAILSDTSDVSQLAQFQQQCADDLFDWVVEIDEEVEVTED